MRTARSSRGASAPLPHGRRYDFYVVFKPAWQLAFPYDVNVPAFRFQRGGGLAIPLHRAGELLFPKAHSGFWRPRPRTALVSMPEAAVNEDGDLLAGKHDVRSTWKPLVMKAIAKPSPMERGPYHEFWS